MLKKLEDGQWLADIRPQGAAGKHYRKKFTRKLEAERWLAWVEKQIRQDKAWTPRGDGRRLSELLRA